MDLLKDVFVWTFAVLIYAVIGHKIAQLSYEVKEVWGKDDSELTTFSCLRLTLFPIFLLMRADGDNPIWSNSLIGTISRRKYFIAHMTLWPFRMLVLNPFFFIILYILAPFLYLVVKLIGMILQDVVSLFNFGKAPESDATETSETTTT